MLLRNSNLFTLFSPHLFHHWFLEQQPRWMHRKGQTQDQQSLWQWLSFLPKTELFLSSQWLQNSWQQGLWMSCLPSRATAQLVLVPLQRHPQQQWVVTHQRLPHYCHSVCGGIPKQHSSVFRKKRHTPVNFEMEKMVILFRYRKYLINRC